MSIWTFILNHLDLNIHATIKKITLRNMLGSIPHQKFCFYHLPTRGRVEIKLGDAWYVSNVSIIFYCSMLLYYLFWMLMGFTLHFYTIFGTNLLTWGPARIAVFFLFQYIKGKEYETESKRNETFGSDLFGTNAIQETWSGCQEAVEAATRVAGAPSKGGCAPLPRGPLMAPLTDFLRLYISRYPKNIQEHKEKLFPPPQPSVPVRTHLGAFFGAPPEGELITEGFYINTVP